MADKPEAPSCSGPPENLDPTKQRSITLPEITLVHAPHIANGHTFMVTSVPNEQGEMIMDPPASTSEAASKWKEQELRAVPVFPEKHVEFAQNIEHVFQEKTEEEDQEPKSSAMLPLSSSLPSRLLRLQAKRGTHSVLRQTEPAEAQRSLDSQFGSEEEGAAAGSSGHSSGDEILPSAPPMALLEPEIQVAVSPTLDDKLDVGMGSSIEGSEESEEDDELKPLAVDNHVLHDIDLSSPASPPTVLSEANLEKFHKHHHAGPYHHMDNIYLHPNFNYTKDGQGSSPPPAVAPANSPIMESKRAHRSFLTMKKGSMDPLEVEKANSVATSKNDDNNDAINDMEALDPSQIPSEELAAEIAEAVEFYFSNDSILKDAFLLKHVRRNKEGFVSLKLVSSFKRVRQLTKDWRVVGNAVKRKSRKIELNDLGTKVRRLDSLPNFDETMPSRTIVACDLPLEKLSIEKVSDMFSKCGEIALIRILKPGMAIPVDVRQFMNKYPEMQQKECALVEYLESSSARDALSLEGPFQVFEMVAPKKKTGKKAVIQLAAPVARMVENYRYYNDASYERTRGGSFSGVINQPDLDLRYKLKRNNSDFPTKSFNDFNSYHTAQHHHNPHGHHHQSTHRGSFGSAEQHSHHTHHYQPRGSISQEQMASSPSSNMNFFAYSPRRYSNSSTISANTAAGMSGAVEQTANPTVGSNPTQPMRRLSNASDSYSSYVDMPSRRTSNCSEHVPQQRRESNCSENCPCSRRVSDFNQQCEQHNNGGVYRKTSTSSIGSGGERRFSNGSMQFERTFSNASELGERERSGSFVRRPSNDFNFADRKDTQVVGGGMPCSEYDGNVGGGGGGYNVFPRRYSNNFNNVSNKLAQYDNAQYINGRRISTDSGYDRRYSFGSEYEGSPRSRTGSFLNNYESRSRTNSFLDNSPRSRSGSFAQRAAESLVRTPIGPDGSKGFGSRARKFGQTISPV